MNSETLEKAKRLMTPEYAAELKADYDKPALDTLEDSQRWERAYDNFIDNAPAVYDAYIAAHESYWALAEEYKEPTLNAQAYCHKYQVGKLGAKCLDIVIADAESLRLKMKEQSDLVKELVKDLERVSRYRAVYEGRMISGEHCLLNILDEIDDSLNKLKKAGAI